MNTFKRFLKPAPKKGAKDDDHGERSSAAAGSDAAQPSTERSSLKSRHSSIYPEGDFRNDREKVSDIKADVMCNWLHQMQLEQLWAHGLAREGVVLKKARDNFTCCPPALNIEPDGFFYQVMAMNVRVCISYSLLWHANNILE